MVNDNKSLLESMSHSLDSTIGFNNNNNNEYAENIKDFAPETFDTIKRLRDEQMAKFLEQEYPTKEDSIKVVDSPVLVPTFRKEDYWGVEGFGDVIESNLSWNKEVMRKKVGHLFCHMTGVWKYSDNGIDWTSIREEFAETFKEVA